MRRVAVLLLAGAIATGLTIERAAAHCQIPCGIYNDELRVQLMEEDVTTIEKSIKEIGALSKTLPPNYNQLVRWVMNKEEHADKVQEIVSDYFLAQRIKHPGTTEGEAFDKYVAQLTLLHQIHVAAMKAKQSADPATVAPLRDLIAKFRVAYFGAEGGHKH